LLPDGYDDFQLHGRLERDGRVRGWAWDPREPEKDVIVELRSEAACLARTAANAYRSDLALLGIRCGCAAFEFAAPAAAAFGALRLVATRCGVEAAVTVVERPSAAPPRLYPRWQVAL
jgi:hypothetical protein